MQIELRKSPKDGNVPLVCSDPRASYLVWEVKLGPVAGVRTSSHLTVLLLPSSLLFLHFSTPQVS